MAHGKTQEVSCSLDELKAGIKVKAGHPVVFVVGGVTGTAPYVDDDDEGDEDETEQASGEGGTEESEAAEPEKEAASEPEKEPAAEDGDDAPEAAAAPDGEESGAEPEKTPAAAPEEPAAPESAAGSATLAIPDGSDVTPGAPLTIHWKVTGAARARLGADLLPGSLVWEGPIGDGGEVVLDVAIDTAAPAKLTMVDDDGTEIEWEFHVDVPEKPGSPATTDSASAFEALHEADLTLALDDKGNGEGDIVLDPGPGQSAIFTLTASPKDGEPAIEPAQVTANVKQNLSLLLMMADGTPAPSGKTCKLSPILDATNEPSGDGEQQLS